MDRCKNITDLIGPYIYGDLDADEMQRVRLHVSECSICKRELEACTRAVALVPNRVPLLSDEERQRVMWTVKGALRAKKEPVRRQWFSPAFAQGFAVAVIVIGAFAAGTFFGFRSKPQKVIVREIVKHEPAPAPSTPEPIVNNPNPTPPDVISPEMPAQMAFTPWTIRAGPQPIYRGGFWDRSERGSFPESIVAPDGSEVLPMKDMLREQDPGNWLLPYPEAPRTIEPGHAGGNSTNSGSDFGLRQR